MSVSGGVIPRWRRDGRELFFVALDGKLMAAPISFASGVPEVGTITPLFGTLPIASGFPYDVSADGQRFLTVVPPDGVGLSQLTIVRNWTAGVKN